MLIIDSEKCIGCGACEDVCAFNAIEIIDDCAQVKDNCTLCGACVDQCDVDALQLDIAEKKIQEDLESWKGVWVYAEFRHGVLTSVAFELLGEGRKLADKLGVELAAVLIGENLADSSSKLVGYGADKVYYVDDPRFKHFSDESYGNILVDLIKKHKPEIVLAGATAIGRSFIPAVANELGAGLTADCTELDVREEDGALLQTRPAFGGNIMATIVCPSSRPQMSTVRPKVMREMEFDAERVGEIIEYIPSEEQSVSRIKVIESVKSEQENVNIQSADILVAGGRGLENEKGFDLVNKLATLLGASVAATRAVVDAGWIAYPHQVGQTGKTVAPKLYIACGISGAIQHVAGMQSAEIIVAINRDAQAPIFDAADFGLVGDLYEIIPKLIVSIQRKKRIACRIP